MRVGIATVQVPFVRGGAEFLAESLARQLRLAGHEAEIISVPFKWYPPERIPEHMLACRLLDLTESCHVPIDRVIGLKFPAYLIPHPNKVLWLLHQHRGAYDLWDHPIGDLRNVPDGDHVRRAIHTADQRVIPQAQGCYTISRNVSDRLQHYCGLPSKPLYHPPPDAEAITPGRYDDYFLLPSRVNTTKRQALVIEALLHTTEPVRVVIMGMSDDPAYGAALRRRTADDAVLRDRVVWAGSVDQDHKHDLYANCLGVVFPVYDEDYGYVTLEAMLAEKAVITCTDSGGPLEFVVDEHTGLACAPEPQAMAVAMDRLWRDRALARDFGLAARRRYDILEISWHTVLAQLLR